MEQELDQHSSCCRIISFLCIQRLITHGAWRKPAITARNKKTTRRKRFLIRSFVLLGRRLNNVLIGRLVISMVSKCVWMGDCFNIMMGFLVSLQVIKDRSKMFLHLLFQSVLCFCADFAQGNTHSLVNVTREDLNTAIVTLTIRSA